MRGALDYTEHGGRRHVVYRSLEHDDDEEESEDRRGKGPAASNGRRHLLIAIGAVVLLVLLALGGAYLYARSEGKSLSELFSTTSEESNTTSPSSSPTLSLNDLTSTSAQKTSAASSGNSSPASSSRTALATSKASTATDSEASATSGASSTGVVVSSTSALGGRSTTESASTAASTSSTTSSSDETDSYWTKTYTGVGTHFPGASSALACGDVYSSPSTTLFAALCHSLYDSPPRVTDDEAENQNRKPTCGDFVAGRKDLEGKWVGDESSSWVVVGGDGELNCVGTEAVRCHVPRTISVTYNGVTVSGVMIVDRNQGIDPSPCDDGDVDLSDLAYLTLGETEVLSSGLEGVSWVWE
ncbi:hypothetical protein BCR35DRAFT_334807 [Leucosporidium creatinivorum]|uniref:Uncharacterized protein n=1 Tax=Leucosporidium creatinivorum TaxID=106004 RepID=A0A1Y2DU93_9BASI|nr:hypothetical protein BCR35DRAFT_334807 [Leucosporidium creatinivorum]